MSAGKIIAYLKYKRRMMINGRHYRQKNIIFGKQEKIFKF